MSTWSESRRGSWQSRALSVTMVAMMGLELVALYSGAAAAGLLVKALVLAMPVIGLTLLRAREFYLFSVAIVLTGLALIDGGIDPEVYGKGLERSGFLASFILLMGLLREGAITSPAVGVCGTYLTQQPPRRRFVAVFAGSHLFSVLINLGALSLFAPIIQRGVRRGRGPDEPLDEIGKVRERRQLSAALRGFSWFLVWAPTAVTQAVLPVLIPGIEPLRLISLGLGVALVMLLVSWAEDTLRWLPLRRRLMARGALPKREATAFPVAAFANLGLVCAALFGLTILFKAAGGVSIVSGVMLAAPVILVGWVYVQQRETAQPLQGARTRLGEIALTAVPGGVREACSLAAAGYIGTLAAALVPIERLAAMGIQGLPPWAFLAALSILVWAGGQVALSPITMAVFLGSLVAALPEIPADPTLAALAIAAGTAICTTGAPFASGTLMLARASGHSGATLTWRWNGAYTALTTAVLVALYFVITGGS